LKLRPLRVYRKARTSPPGCPSSVASDFVKSHWTPNDDDVNGIRAPIKVRRDGRVCTGGPELGFAAAWISIEDQGGTGITQIGWIHIYDPSIGAGKWCRFFAIGVGAVQTYGTCDPTDDTFLYLEIQKQFDPERHAYFYDVYDCGTGGGYGDCQSKSWSQAPYASSLAAIDVETDYGKSACTVEIMGSSDDRQNFGQISPSYPIQGQNDAGDGWGTKTLVGGNATCSDYLGTFSDSQMKTYDDRNTG
jgi:hypothetical protein